MYVLGSLHHIMVSFMLGAGPLVDLYLAHGNRQIITVHVRTNAGRPMQL